MALRGVNDGNGILFGSVRQKYSGQRVKTPKLLPKYFILKSRTQASRFKAAYSLF